MISDSKPAAGGRLFLQRAFLIAAAVGILALAYRMGVLDRIREPGRVKESLLELGAGGFAIYLATYTALQPFGVPGTAFVVAAGLIWPPQVAIPLAMAGTILATVAGFSFARFIARDWVARRIPPRFHAYDQRLEKHGFATVFLLRSVLWMNPTLHALFGLSRIRFSTHLAASTLAYIAPVVGIILLGDRIFDRLRNLTVVEWIEVGAAAALLMGVVALIMRRRPPGQA